MVRVAGSGSDIDRRKKRGSLPESQVDNADVAAFLDQVARTPMIPGGRRGRLIFALDATASREPTWDRACHLQAEMFGVTAELGGLDVQLVFYRGFGECRASGWVSDPATLARRMESVRCRGGLTQVGKVLAHARKEAQKEKVAALVLVGDAFEEDVDRVADKAGELGLRGVKTFVFQEGHDPVASHAFAEIARLTGGAHCRFDPGSAGTLRELLRAVAVYAAGGPRALEDMSRRDGGEAKRIAGLLAAPGR